MAGGDVGKLKRMRRGEDKFLGSLEAQVMDRVWSRGSATVRDIVSDLARTRQLAYTTVMTIMTRLHDKGLLRRAREGKTYVYRPAFSRQEFRARLSRDIVRGLVARLAPDELRAVLAHECWHVARRDPLRIVVARYFAAGLYVIPIIDDLVAHYDLVKEVAADEHAVDTLGDVRPLARALYRLMPHADDMDLGLLAPVGGLSVTEARIEQLVEHRPIVARVPRLHVALSVATLVAALVLLAGHAPLVGRLDILLAWPPAALIALAAVPGVAQQLRAVAHK